MYQIRPKLFVTIVLVVLIMTWYILQNTNYRMYTYESSTIPSNLNFFLSHEGFFYEPSTPIEPLEEIIIHLDLKGAPPKVSYVLDFIPLVRKMGGTGLLLEYEDMFPYHDELEHLKALNAYTLPEISLINESAERNNLTIIPLVQTFGHLEFVLKLEKYQSYREVDVVPQALCPNQRNITEVVEKMISQVLDAHPQSKYFHMGCNEVNYVGVCTRCHRMMKKNKWRKDDIYFRHVKKIAQYITKKSPWVRPIVWGDQFNKKNEKLILSLDLPQMVDVMLFYSKPDPTQYLKATDMQRYARLFDSIWIAGAFKASSGRPNMVTIPLKHYTNNRGWMHFASQWKDKIKFKGIALTGRQRYSHFSALGELLPVAIPNLALSLQAVSETNGLNFTKFKQTLRCNHMPPLTKEDVKDLKHSSKLHCNFLGFNIYYYIHLLNDKIKEVQKALDVFTTGDLFLYNTLSNFSDPFLIKQLSDRNDLKSFLDDINDLENKIRLTLGEVYDENTISEWIMTYVLPYKLRLEAATKTLEAMTARKTWPNRPFPNSEGSIRDFFKRICGPLERRGCNLLNIRI